MRAGRSGRRLHGGSAAVLRRRADPDGGPGQGGIDQGCRNRQRPRCRCIARPAARLPAPEPPVRCWASLPAPMLPALQCSPLQAGATCNHVGDAAAAPTPACSPRGSQGASGAPPCPPPTCLHTRQLPPAAGEARGGEGAAISGRALQGLASASPPLHQPTRISSWLTLGFSVSTHRGSGARFIELCSCRCSAEGDGRILVAMVVSTRCWGSQTGRWQPLLPGSMSARAQRGRQRGAGPGAARQAGWARI